MHVKRDSNYTSCWIHLFLWLSATHLLSPVFCALLHSGFMVVISLQYHYNTVRVFIASAVRWKHARWPVYAQAHLAVMTSGVYMETPGRYWTVHPQVPSLGLFGKPPFVYLPLRRGQLRPSKHILRAQLPFLLHVCTPRHYSAFLEWDQQKTFQNDKPHQR